jgi:hypothetical protein
MHLKKYHGVPRISNKKLQINHDIQPNFSDPNNFCKSCNRTCANKNSCRAHIYSYHNTDAR